MSARSGPAHSGIPRVPSPFCPLPATGQVAAELPPLVVLRTPRGYGKTSTVAHWAGAGLLPGGTVAWVRLSGPVSGPAFWLAVHEELVAAGVARAVDHPGPADVDHALGGLRQRLVLVLDGLQHVTGPAVDDEVVALVQRHELVHVIVMTRGRRPIETVGPLTVDTAILTTRELSFAPAQTTMLAQGLGMQISQDEARRLTEDLAGWPALVRGVLVAARSSTGGATGSGPGAHDDGSPGAEPVCGSFHREMDLVTRFARVVLQDPENAEWYTVMTALAVPAFFTLGDSKALLGGGAAIGLVHEVSHTPFVRADAQGRYAVVPLVRAALREVLREQDPDRFRRLSEVMARRRHDAGQPEPALAHAVDAEAWPVVLSLVEKNWTELLRSDVSVLRAAVEGLAAPVVESSARLVVVRDYVLDNSLLQDAAQAMRSGLLVPDSDLRVRPLTVTQRLRLRRAFDGHRPGTGTIPVSVLADGLAGRPGDSVSGATGSLSGAPGGVLEGPGEARRSLAVAREVPELLIQWALSQLYDNDPIVAAYGFALACREAVEAGEGAAAREAAVGAGLVMAVLGHLHPAEAWLARAPELSAQISALERVAEPLARAVIAGLRLQPLPVARWSSRRPEADDGLAPLVELARVVGAHRDVHLGRTERAGLELRRPGVDGYVAELTMLVVMSAAVAADLALVTGDHDRAAGLLAATDAQGPAIRTARARQLFYIGAHQEVLRRTADALTYSETRPRAGLELLLLRACSFLRLGRQAAAADALASVVAIAGDTGVLLPFTSVPRADLLQIAGEGTRVRKFLDSEPLEAAGCPFPRPLHAEELSAAELRVLHELAAGYLPAGVARVLFLSEATVRTHLQRIYRKLGVRSHEQALRRAQALNLLPARD